MLFSSLVLSSIFAFLAVGCDLIISFIIFFSFVIFVPLHVLQFLGASCSPSFIDNTFFVDEVSFMLVYITSLILFVSFFSHSFNDSVLPLFVFLTLFVSSFVVFSTSSFFVLYLFYEASLVPITYAILKWGSYPERGVSSLIMLLFTSVFTFPLTLVVLLYLLESSSFLLFSYTLCTPPPMFFVFWVLLSFSVKLPLYGFHYWLPIAHVEAPTFGSIILAGLLLNMGGCGLYRLLPLISPSLSHLSCYLLSFAIFSVILSCLSTCVQSDMKRLVAYSSVVHMSFVLLIILSPSPLTMNALLMLIVFHGLSSPLIFHLVGVLYNICSTRLIYLLRGLLLCSPLLTFFVTLAFLVSVPVPPFSPFVSEVLLFAGVYNLTGWVSIVILSSLIVVLLYNLLWFIGLAFDKPVFSLSVPSTLQLFLSFVLLLVLLASVVVLFIF